MKIVCWDSPFPFREIHHLLSLRSIFFANCPAIKELERTCDDMGLWPMDGYGLGGCYPPWN